MGNPVLRWQIITKDPESHSGLYHDIFGKANLGSATGVLREPPIWWAMVISQFGLAAVVTYVFLHAGVATASDGLQTGAVFGLLLGHRDFVRSLRRDELVEHDGGVRRAHRLDGAILARRCGDRVDARAG